MTTVTPILAQPELPPVTGVVIELNAADARELLSIIGWVSPSGEWVSQLYKGLHEALRIPSSEIVRNTKFSLTR